MTATGKTDRRRLREVGEGMTLEQLTALNAPGRQRRQPGTSMERHMQSLWSAVLGIKADGIGADDSFLSLGGDSIQAIKLAQRVRHQGLSLSVADILQHPQLFKMATLLQRPGDSQRTAQSAYRPFSLLVDGQRGIKKRLHEFGVTDEAVQDILPVTDRQSEDIAMTYSAARRMLVYHTLDGNGTPDISKMQKACADLMTRFDMLRTVFIVCKNSFLQIILKNFELKIPVFQTDRASIAEYTEDLRQHDMKSKLRFGQLLTGFTIIHHTGEQKYRLVVRMSHAQYDGISMDKMWKSFVNFYSNGLHTNDETEPSFSQHMHMLSLANKQEAIDYWRRLLMGSSLTSLKCHTKHTLTRSKTLHITKATPLAQ